jgi:adenine deaminase
MGHIQSIEELLGFLLRRRWLILAVALVGTLLSAVYAKTRPDIYETAAVIQVQSAAVQGTEAQRTSAAAVTLQGIEQRLTTRENLAAVIERHGVNGNKATGFVQGFGLQRGAIASTVCHDHHNIAVVGVDYADMALAANRLGEIEGGFVVVEGGRVLAELALPVAGLMSLNSFEEVHQDLIALRAAAKSLGVVLEEPFLQLAFLALPVIPHLKITDHGMVDVDRFEVIP